MSAEAIAIVAVGAALLADLRDDVKTLRTETRSDMADLRGDVQALRERVARIEGRLDALAPVMVPMRPMAEPVRAAGPAA